MRIVKSKNCSGIIFNLSKFFLAQILKTPRMVLKYHRGIVRDFPRNSFKLSKNVRISVKDTRKNFCRPVKFFVNVQLSLEVFEKVIVN